MEYRIAATIVNDDAVDDPSPESIAHIIRHLLRGEGVTTVDVAAVPEHTRGTDDRNAATDR